MATRLEDMTFTGLKVVIISHLLFFCLYIDGVLAQPSATLEGIAPERNISVVGDKQDSLEWKHLWEKARDHIRAGDYTLAASVYSELYKRKPNVEQANWEYCKVLLKTGDFKSATKIIATLLERNPHRIEYFLAGGQAAIQGKEWEAAARYYGRVLEQDPLGELSEVALEGLVTSLRNTGKKEFVLPLAENLMVRQADNLKLLQKIALDMRNSGQNEKARLLFNRLLEAQDVEDKVLLQAIEVFDIPGKEKDTSVLLEKYIKRHPENLSFRNKLVDYYLKNEAYDAALGHLVYLIDHQEDNEAFLLKAGTINLYQLGRPDKALIYYEKYQKKHPDNKEIKQKIANIQDILANDFLSIVENDGAWMLWRDLAKVTPNRAAIYLQMADLLESKGMVKEHLDVLSIIHHHHPDDENISLRLAQKYFDLKQYENALNFLDRVVQKRNRNKAYYVLRANLEMELGREVDALSSYEAVLQFDAGDAEIRKISMELAGSLGNAAKLQTLFESYVKHNKRQPSKDILFTYLDQLNRNFLFHEYEQISNHYRGNFFKESKVLDKLDLHFADALRREGKTKKAEQLLRQLLKDKRSVNDVLFALTSNAISDKNLDAAKTWYGLLDKISTPEKSGSTYDTDGFRRLLLKIKIARNLGEFDVADNEIRRFSAIMSNEKSSKEFMPLLAELQKERCWLSYYRGDYKTALRHLETFLEFGVFSADIITLRSLLLSKKNQQLKNEVVPSENLSAGFSLRTNHRLAIIESDLAYQEYEAAERQIQTVLQYGPDSVVGRVLWAKLQFARGRFSDASVPLQQLNDLFLEERYFYKKLVEIEVRRGNYSKGLALLTQKNGEMTEADPVISGLTQSDDIEELLTLARLLWGEKQHEKALKIYRKLLSPSIPELLSEKFRQKQMDYLYLTKEKTIWNSILVMIQSEPDIVAELMEPAFLVDNLTNEAGKIVAEHYELYSWQKMISTEYLARKAIYERKYTYAEQSGKRLVDEQGTLEGMMDLAGIYGRIGKYRKEAQVYEAIQNTGTTSPELVKSMERSSLQLSPQNIFDTAYSAKDGRNGFIDVEKVSVGTSFWFTPDLDTDIRLAYSNNNYKSVDGSASAGSNLLFGTAIYEFAKDFELVFGAGTEKMDGTSNARFLHKIELKGQLDEFFHTYVEWGKSLVYDTVEALNEGITKQEIEAGLYCETPLGLTFGGDFRHRSYSDNNSQNRFHGYSSYGLFGESVHLSLRYDYQFFKNTEVNTTEIHSPDTRPQEVLFYWSPSSYSENLITLHFQHDFLGYHQGQERKLSYYALDNSIGYDDLETLSYSSKFDIFLEMNPHFLLKGNFTFAKSDVYEEKGLSLSLHYRW